MLKIVPVDKGDLIKVETWRTQHYYWQDCLREYAVRCHGCQVYAEMKYLDSFDGPVYCFECDYYLCDECSGDKQCVYSDIRTEAMLCQNCLTAQNKICPSCETMVYDRDKYGTDKCIFCQQGGFNPRERMPTLMDLDLSGDESDND